MSHAASRPMQGATLRDAAALELHIGRVVWHGAGSPDAAALARAVEIALSRELAQQPPVPATDALSRLARSIARQLLPALAARGRG